MQHELRPALFMRTPDQMKATADVKEDMERPAAHGSFDMGMWDSVKPK